MGEYDSCGRLIHPNTKSGPRKEVIESWNQTFMGWWRNDDASHTFDYTRGKYAADDLELTEEILKGSAVLRHFYRGYIFPPLIRIVSFYLAIFKYLINLHETVTIMKIIIQIDKHLTAGHILAVLEFDSDKNRSYQRDSQRENADRGFISCVKIIYTG